MKINNKIGNMNPLKTWRNYFDWRITQLDAGLNKRGDQVFDGIIWENPPFCIEKCSCFEHCHNSHDTDYFGEKEGSIRSSIIPPHVDMFTRFKQLYLQNFCISGDD